MTDEHEFTDEDAQAIADEHVQAWDNLQRVARRSNLSMTETLLLELLRAVTTDEDEEREPWL